MMSDWDGIDEFVAVATTNSFTKAARAIGMSPTHVSRSIGELERRVQAPLFNRTTRTVSLTDAGRVFFEHCQRLVLERDEAIALIGEQGEPQGELRISCSTTMGERFVAPIIRRLTMQHPKLNVSIELSNNLVDLVGDGFDLAIRTGELKDGRLLGTLVAERRFYTCAAPDYLARQGEPKTVQDLSDHQCIKGTSTSWHYLVGGKDIHHRPSGRYRCNSGQAVIEACVAGLGICQLLEFYVLPYLRHGMVKLLLEDIRPKDEPIWAVYPRRRHLLPKIHAALEALKLELGPTLHTDHRD
ncbi:transcriptional regulator, LysR family [Sphingobium sp. YR768]|nr:transcriptional regulator, LysR family [Sphingobium sp. YR768]